MALEVVVPADNPELATDLDMNDSAAWTPASGTGTFAVTGGEMVLSRLTSSIITMTGAKATALAASLTAIGAGVVFDVVVVVSAFTSFVSGAIGLRFGTGVNLNITGPGTYTFQVTSGSNGAAGNAIRIANFVGVLSITSISIKQH